MYLAREGIYTSDGPTPSFPECLKATKDSIFWQYAMRIAPKDFEDIKCLRGLENFGDRSITGKFWDEVVEWLKQNHSATKVAESIEFYSSSEEKGYVPDAPDSLYAAVAYWVEAADAHDRLKDTERSWAALLMSNFYLGMASGPKSPLEMAASGGGERTKAFDRLFVPTLLKWLQALPENGFGSMDAAIDDFLPQAEAFRTEWRHEQPSWSSSSLRRYIKKLGKRDDAIGQQLTALFNRAIRGNRRGPKRRSKT